MRAPGARAGAVKTLICAQIGAICGAGPGPLTVGSGWESPSRPMSSGRSGRDTYTALKLNSRLLVGVIATLTCAGLLYSAPAMALSVPPQGTWENCDVVDHASICDARLRVMRQTGLSFAMVAPGSYAPRAIAAYASGGQR